MVPYALARVCHLSDVVRQPAANNNIKLLHTFCAKYHECQIKPNAPTKRLPLGHMHSA